MVQELITSASFGPASELLSQTINTVFETLRAAKHVLTQKQNFKKFSHYLHQIVSVLKDLQRQNLDCSDSFKHAVEILHREVESSRQIIVDCTNKNKIYLLVNCKRIVQSIDRSTKEIARALDLLPLASPDVSLGIREKIIDIGKNMIDCEYSISKSEAEIMTKIELGIRERKTDRSYSNELMIQIADAVGISPSNSVFKTEFEEFKREIGVELRMEQIIALLETSDVIMSHDEKERKYLDKRNLLGQQSLEPLRSFFCPITLEVMADPVETVSGMTFEKSAIEKWFETGNRNCPLTLMPLERLDLRPNKNMRQSIEEWKERNNMMAVASIRPKLESSDEEEVVGCLERLRVLCSEKEAHREWVMHENYVPVLTGLLRVKNGEIRRHVLHVLRSLANDSNENKEVICGTNNALEYVVRSLARNVNESKLAMQLLQQLSECNVGRQAMGKIRGCIFSLVTISMKEDNEIETDAQQLLQRLAFVNENVVQMANANYFRPLLHLLNSGTEDEKVTMAKTLSEIEMTERQKLYLSEQGILSPLIELLSHDDAETKRVTVKCLESLSMVRQNGRKMIEELGIVAPLLDLLYRHGSSSPARSLREHVAATIMHLAQSTTISRQDELDEVSLLESEDDIFKLFCLISLTGPGIQCNIMRAFRAMCRSPSGSYIRTKLRQLSAVQVLVQLCEAPNFSVRANAVKLFCCLTEEDNQDSLISEHVNRKCVESLLEITETSADTGEAAAAMGIISNLPRDTQITQWLLEAGALQTILTLFSQETLNVQTKKRRVLENAVGALCRFTVSTNLEWQKEVAESGIIPHLVRFLTCGTTLMKQNATVCLKQLSESSSVLTQLVKKNAVFRCFAAPPEDVCPAHSGICSVESSFCLVEANAVDPLVKLLRDKDFGVCEAALEALLTLIEGERLQSGSGVLAGADAVGPIIKLLSLSSSSIKLKEKCLKALHRLFESVEVKQKFGISAHMAILEITQRDDTGMKSLAAKVLAQLGVLQDQSSFF